MEKVENDVTFIVSTEILKENMRKAIARDKRINELEEEQRKDKRFLSIVGFVVAIITTIAITQLFLIKTTKVNENTITECHGGILEVCVTKAK